MDKIKVKFKKLHSEAKMPFRKHEGDAGYDLFAVEDKVLYPGIMSIPTGICLQMPKGYYCEIHTRSSHGVQGLRNHLGIIDEGYHGEITILMNVPLTPGTSLNPLMKIFKGEKVAQLIFKKRTEVEFEESNEEFESSRGTGGFGSTGK